MTSSSVLFTVQIQNLLYLPYFYSSLFELMTLNMSYTCCTPYWDVEIGNLPVLDFWGFYFLVLIPNDTLWPWPLILWSWTSEMYRLWCDQTLYQILAKSSNPRLSYNDLKSENLDAVRHLWVHRKWILTSQQPRVFHNAPAYQISAQVSQRAGRRPARSRSFVGWPNCTQFVENREHRPIIDA